MVAFDPDDTDNWDAADDTVDNWGEEINSAAAEYPDEYDDFNGLVERSEDLEHEEETEESADEKPQIEPEYANVVEFVEGYILPVVRRKIGDSDSSLSWDARWWAYPEVVARFTALHYAWEEAHASDSMSAMSSWWIQHLEPHLRVILDGDSGPMSNAKTTRDWMGWPAMPADDVPTDVYARIVD